MRLLRRFLKSCCCSLLALLLSWRRAWPFRRPGGLSRCSGAFQAQRRRGRLALKLEGMLITTTIFLR